MSKTTSFILGPHFDRLVADEVRSGRYASASEVVREGLRLVEERQRRIDALAAAVDAGLASGVAEEFSWDRVRREGQRAAEAGD